MKTITEEQFSSIVNKIAEGLQGIYADGSMEKAGAKAVHEIVDIIKEWEALPECGCQEMLGFMKGIKASAEEAIRCKTSVSNDFIIETTTKFIAKYDNKGG